MVRGAPLILLILTAGSRHVDAQPLTCSTIRPGDTVSGLAVRLTGAARNRERPWFQVVDPATRRIVAKSQYDRIHAGWRACVVGQTTEAPLRVSLVRAPAAGVASPWIVAARVIRDPEVAPLLWMGLVMAAASLGNAVERYITRRQTTVAAMRQFGVSFIREFERPLLQPVPPRPPVRSQLRACPARGRLEILLAPGDGRRYPNLADHKANVAYDIVRILQVLGDHPFACAPPYTRGGWVVVPFHVQRRSKTGR